jgi:magnesium chelatase family protein
MDRIDIQISVPRVDLATLRQQGKTGETSAQVRARVSAARTLQLQRASKPNAHLSGAEIDRFCSLNQEDTDFLDQAMQRLQMSMRGYSRVLKTARTIADLAGQESIARAHLLESLSYRENLHHAS